MLYNGSQNNQQMYYQQPNNQPVVQQMNAQPQQKGSIDVVVMIHDNSVVNNYPVAPNTTVMFVNFNAREFLLKTVDNFGRQYPISTYSFTIKEEPKQEIQNDSKRVDDLDRRIEELSKSVKDMYKMLEDLTAPSEKTL